MSTATPSRTAGGASHSRSDHASRFIDFIFYLQFIYIVYDLDRLKIENLVWHHYGQNGMTLMLILNHGKLEVQKREKQERVELVWIRNRLV
jgi:hypothetical protein